MIKIHKFGKRRICFSLANIFVKITIGVTNENINSGSMPLLSKILISNNIASYPNVFLDIMRRTFRITISKYLKKGESLQSNIVKVRVLRRLYNMYDSIILDIPSIDWTHLFDSDVIKRLRVDHKNVYLKCEKILGSKLYYNTGVHGDLNPNNVLLESDNIYFIDWENSRNSGDFLWDLYWFYAISNRKSSKPGKDIQSLLDGGDNILGDIIEVSIIYAAMKWHVDIYRHNRDKSRAFDDLLLRLNKIVF